MKKLLFILLIFISGLTKAAVYYVATNGNDSADGSITTPWATWQKGFESLTAGDTLYIRGGTYMTSGSLNYGDYHGVYVSNIDGTVTDTIKVLAYPNETPILDCSNMTQNGIHFGILLDNGCDYWHIKGLTLQNVTEYDNGDGTYVVADGWDMSATNTIVENCVIRNSPTGFAAQATADYLYFKNCDAYNLHDYWSDGGYANGFLANINPGKHVYFEGCRAWNCSDDGFDTFGGDGYITFENCWSFANGFYIQAGNGSGFKLGIAENAKEAGVQRTLKNCLAFDNTETGFDESADYEAKQDMNLYNCVSFRNGSTGFYFNQSVGSGIVTIANCISYQDATYRAILRSSVVVHTSSFLEASGAEAEINTNYTITDADFLSVDTTGVSGARQADGSLPDLNFLKLVSGSDLIDTGTDVGIDYNGTAPDLGVFEFTATTPVSGSTTIQTNGSGVYYKLTNGKWWGGI